MSDYVYGKNSFFEALNSGRILKAYVLNDALIKDRKISYKIVDRKKLDSMVKGNHQGYVAEVKPYELSDVEDMIRDKNGLIVMLDGLEEDYTLCDLYYNYARRFLENLHEIQVKKMDLHALLSFHRHDAERPT